MRLSEIRREYLALPKVEAGVYLAEPLRHLTYRRKIDPRGTYRIRVNAGLSGKVHPMRRSVGQMSFGTTWSIPFLTLARTWSSRQ